jgi:hypothetical protein
MAESGVIDQVLMNRNAVWVPHPRDAFVFVARVGGLDANILGPVSEENSVQVDVLKGHGFSRAAERAIERGL